VCVFNLSEKECRINVISRLAPTGCLLLSARPLWSAWSESRVELGAKLSIQTQLGQRVGRVLMVARPIWESFQFNERPASGAPFTAIVGPAAAELAGLEWAPNGRAIRPNLGALGAPNRSPQGPASWCVRFISSEQCAVCIKF